jgi:cell division septation protein DedD
LVLLAVGFTLTSAVVFLLGILVGKGIEERKLLKKEEPLVKIPVQPLIPGSKAGSTPKEEMTFYDTLAKARTSEKPTKDSKASEKATKTEARETQSIAKRAPLPAKEANKKGSTEKGSSAPEIKKEAPAQKMPEAQTAKAEMAKREGPWAVQVTAYSIENEAKALAKKLKDKGYDAYVVTSQVKGRAWYRVRVGHLETRDQAQQLQETLKQKENLTKSITTSR